MIIGRVKRREKKHEFENLESLEQVLLCHYIVDDLKKRQKAQNTLFDTPVSLESKMWDIDNGSIKLNTQGRVFLAFCEAKETLGSNEVVRLSYKDALKAMTTLSKDCQCANFEEKYKYYTGLGFEEILENGLIDSDGTLNSRGLMFLLNSVAMSLDNEISFNSPKFLMQDKITNIDKRIERAEVGYDFYKLGAFQRAVLINVLDVRLHELYICMNTGGYFINLLNGRYFVDKYQKYWDIDNSDKVVITVLGRKYLDDKMIWNKHSATYAAYKDAFDAVCAVYGAKDNETLLERFLFEQNIDKKTAEQLNYVDYDWISQRYYIVDKGLEKGIQAALNKTNEILLPRCEERYKKLRLEYGVAEENIDEEIRSARFEFNENSVYRYDFEK